MSQRSRAYCERRITAIDRRIAERRPYAGPIWPRETPDGIVYGAFVGVAGQRPDVDDLLEQRARWTRLLKRQL